MSSPYGRGKGAYGQPSQPPTLKRSWEQTDSNYANRTHGPSQDPRSQQSQSSFHPQRPTGSQQQRGDQSYRAQQGHQEHPAQPQRLPAFQQTTSTHYNSSQQQRPSHYGDTSGGSYNYSSSPYQQQQAPHGYQQQQWGQPQRSQTLSPMEKWFQALVAQRVAPPSHLDVAEKSSSQLRESTLPPDHKLGTIKRVLLQKGFGFIQPKKEYGAGVVVDDEEEDGAAEAADGPPQKKRRQEAASASQDGKDIFFLLNQVTGAKPQDGDLVSFRLTQGRQGLMAADVTVIREASKEFSQSDIDNFLRGVYNALDGRCMLVCILEQWSSWKKVLQSRSLQRTQILLLLAISSRSRLPDLMMKTSLSAFYTSILSSAFVRSTLPGFIRHSHSCTPQVIEDIQNFCRLLHRNCSGKLCPFMHPLIIALASWHRMNNWQYTTMDKLEELGTLFTDTEEEKKLEEAGPPFLYPTEDDFKDPEEYMPETMPPNKVQGPYDSPEEYVHTQFKLLRSDCFSEFVESMYYKAFAQQAYEMLPDRRKGAVQRATRFYSGVELVGVNMSLFAWNPTQWTLTFKTQEKVNWQNTNRLEQGRLLLIVAFSEAGSELFWMVVTHRDPWLLERGIVGVEFVKGDPLFLLHCLEFNRLAGTQHHTRLCESNIFFPAYRPVLQTLRHLSHNIEELPFQSFFVYGNPQPFRPEYIRNNLPIFRQLLQRQIEESTFDESQLCSIQAMEHAFLLVQGPPGTGKSYVGVRMARLVYDLRNAVMEQKDAERKAALQRTLQPYVQEQEKDTQMLAQLEERMAALRATVQQQQQSFGGFRNLAPVHQEMEMIGQQAATLQQNIEAVSMKQQELKTQFEFEGLTQRQAFGPIMIITFKNHALDEYLLDCLQWLKDPDQGNLIRIGAGCQNEELRKCGLNEAVRAELKGTTRNYEAEIRRQLEANIRTQRQIVEQVAAVQTAGVTPSLMLRYMTDAQAASFGPLNQQNINRWLGQKWAETPPNPWMKYVTHLQSCLEAENLSKAERAPSAYEMKEKKAEEAAKKKKKEKSGGWDNMLADEGAEEDESDRDDEGVTLSAFAALRQDHLRELRAERRQKEQQTASVEFLKGFSPLLHGRHAFTKQAAKAEKSMEAPEVAKCSNLKALSSEEKQALVRYWVQKQTIDLYERYANVMGEFEELNTTLREHLQQVKLDILRRAQLIGLTSTGCAANLALLREVKPVVVFVEEAAEILESQIISCLTPDVQQIVLLGDHKQLRPLVNNFALAKHCHIDLSLFERMGNNGVRCQMLSNQRRMTSEISEFVKPIYEHLYDDPALEGRLLPTAHGELEAVPGVGRQVFFWSHEFPETQSAHGMSVMNPGEIQMVSDLAAYLLANGVLPSSITVLTPYKGQLMEMKRRMANLGPIDIQTVDRFQGDENDIILLSLVRARELTEFIRRQDRMVVALSRARFAMFIFGNHRLLDKAEMPHWQQTMRILQKPWAGDNRPRVGPALPLCCARHPKVQVLAYAGRPFPTRFCPNQCGETFDGCDDESHVCTRPCHPGGHEKCPYPCSRPMDCGHPCQRKCWQDCECLARAEVPIGCSHQEAIGYDPQTKQIRYRVVQHTQNLKCGDAPQPCKRVVPKIRPGCLHEVKVPCDVDPSEGECEGCAEAAKKAVEDEQRQKEEGAQRSQQEEAERAELLRKALEDVVRSEAAARLDLEVQSMAERATVAAAKAAEEARGPPNELQRQQQQQQQQQAQDEARRRAEEQQQRALLAAKVKQEAEAEAKELQRLQEVAMQEAEPGALGLEVERPAHGQPPAWAGGPPMFRVQLLVPPGRTEEELRAQLGNLQYEGLQFGEDAAIVLTESARQRDAILHWSEVTFEYFNVAAESLPEEEAVEEAASADAVEEAASADALEGEAAPDAANGQEMDDGWMGDGGSPDMLPAAPFSPDDAFAGEGEEVVEEQYDVDPEVERQQQIELRTQQALAMADEVRRRMMAPRPAVDDTVQQARLLVQSQMRQQFQPQPQPQQPHQPQLNPYAQPHPQLQPHAKPQPHPQPQPYPQPRGVSAYARPVAAPATHAPSHPGQSARPPQLMPGMLPQSLHRPAQPQPPVHPSAQAPPHPHPHHHQHQHQQQQYQPQPQAQPQPQYPPHQPPPSPRGPAVHPSLQPGRGPPPAATHSPYQPYAAAAAQPHAPGGAAPLQPFGAPAQGPGAGRGPFAAARGYAPAGLPQHGAAASRGPAPTAAAPRGYGSAPPTAGGPLGAGRGLPPPRGPALPQRGGGGPGPAYPRGPYYGH